MLMVELGPVHGEQEVPGVKLVVTREGEVDENGEALRLRQHRPNGAGVVPAQIDTSEQP